MPYILERLIRIDKNFFWNRISDKSHGWGYFFVNPACNITPEVYNITPITTHLNASKGNDFIIKAARPTAIIPGIAMATAAFRL